MSSRTTGERVGPDPGDGGAGQGYWRGSRRHPLQRWFLPVAVAVLLLAGSVVPLPAFVELPGSIAGIPACVAIDGPVHSVSGDYLLTTVGHREATVFGLALAGIRDDQRVVSRRELLGGVRRDRYLDGQRRVFSDATDRAVAVALRAAGLAVDILGSGADVVDVIPDTPADGVLRAGDVVTAVDGASIATDADLIAAIDDADPIVVRVRRDGTEHTVELTPEMREVEGRRRPMIGVRITTLDPRLGLPFDVQVRSGRVGGPSAGLMIGLAVLDMVDDSDLARGRRIAGTGTLALDGSVGTIDGVDLKVAAAARGGADVFLAPASQAATALAAVPTGSDLAVIGVDSFDEARRALDRHAADDTATPAVARSGAALPCRFRPDA